MAQSARSRAVANSNQAIDDSQARAVAARQEQRPSALAQMATRLSISEGKLVSTLRSTVFAGCKTDEEFAALMVVANEYRLNPLTKEIYAFPAKGGGIVPMVSVDGWIRIMNEHPQFDGIEFEDIVDEKGNVTAIEATIYRKDRTRPIKTMEYLDECRRGTEPWKMMPSRMLRHKALIQCARLAFGFSGIHDPEEVAYATVDGGDATPPRQQVQRLPSREELADHDEDTGEVIDQQPAKDGMTEVDEETARQLDAEQGYGSAEPEPEPDTQEPEQSEARKQVNAILERVSKAGTVIDLNTVEQDWAKKVRGGCEADMIELVEARIADRRAELKQGAAK